VCFDLDAVWDGALPAVLVLGSDGLWDRMTSAEMGRYVAQFVSQRLAAGSVVTPSVADELARVLVRTAMKKGARDNVTAVVVILGLNVDDAKE